MPQVIARQYHFQVGKVEQIKNNYYHGMYVIYYYSPNNTLHFTYLYVYMKKKKKYVYLT